MNTQTFHDELKAFKEETQKRFDEIRMNIEINEELFKKIRVQQENLDKHSEYMDKILNEMTEKVEKIIKPYSSICPAEPRKPVLESPFKHNPTWNDCKEAVAKNGLYLQYVPDKLRDDYIICKIAFNQNKECLKFMSDDMAVIILRQDDPNYEFEIVD